MLCVCKCTPLDIYLYLTMSAFCVYDATTSYQAPVVKSRWEDASEDTLDKLDGFRRRKRFRSESSDDDQELSLTEYLGRRELEGSSYTTSATGKKKRVCSLYSRTEGWLYVSLVVCHWNLCWVLSQYHSTSQIFLISLCTCNGFRDELNQNQVW